MRSLFLKVFLWFWLAVALVIAAYVVATETTRSAGQIPPPWHKVADNSLPIYAQTAAEIYERDGRPALASYFDRVERTSNLRAFLFDERGDELSGRAAPPAGAPELASEVERRGKSRWNSNDPGALAAYLALGSDNRRYVLVAQLPHKEFNSLRFNPFGLILRVLSALLTAGVLCYWLARYIVNPIVKLSEVTRQFAGGDLTARVGPAMGRRRDELADLGRDFDLMAARIESLIGAQRRLLSDISHELRSPLARLGVALELARRRTGQDATSALDRIEREAKRLNEMIGQLLSLARWESSTNELKAEPVDLTHIVREVAEDADFEARSRNRRVRVEACEGCVVMGNGEMLRSAIENVVRNAVRYTAESSAIEITLRCEDVDGSSQAAVSVRDHGAGVPEEALAHLFTPFYRVADARDRKTGGTGLGLAITERAVRLHGGSVAATNAPGGGLIVEMILPAVAQSPSGGEDSNSNLMESSFTVRS